MDDSTIVVSTTDPLGRDVVLGKSTYDYKRMQHDPHSGSAEDVQVCVSDPDYVYKSQWGHSPNHSMYYHIDHDSQQTKDIQKVIVDHGYTPGRVVTFFKTDTIGTVGAAEHVRSKPRR